MKSEIVNVGLITAIVSSVLWGCSNDNAANEQASSNQPSATSETVTVHHAAPAITGADAPKEKPVILADGSLAPLPIEKIGRINILPDSYPESWVLVDESSFSSMFGGKLIVMDIAETKHPKRIKGLMDKNLLGNFAQSKTRGEYYIMESFHERGSRGKLTDVLAIYDKKTLAIKKEILWPMSQRLASLPERYAASLSMDEKFLYLFNFTPAASFTVIDLDTHEIMNKVETPGCVLTYPLGNRAVASICSNGGMLSSLLDNNGKLKSQKRMPPFFDTSKTPVFEQPTIINGKAYFASFEGLMHEFDLSGDEAKYLGNWSLVNEEQKAANRRPSGIFLSDADDAGLLYIIFQEDGKEGTQTHGGSEIWVFDPKQQKRLRVIEAPNWAISVTATRGDNPLLVVTSGELNLDIFNPKDGSLVQTVSDFGQTTPLSVRKSY